MQILGHMKSLFKIISQSYNCLGKQHCLCMSIVNPAHVSIHIYFYLVIDKCWHAALTYLFIQEVQKTEDTNRWDRGQGDHSDGSNKKGRSKSSARRASKAHHKNKKREIIFSYTFFSYRSIFISASFLNLLKKRKRKKKISVKIRAKIQLLDPITLLQHYIVVHYQLHQD